jgi:hypothetical protein
MVPIGLGILTVTAIIVGVMTTRASYPHTIPHQVIKAEIPMAPQPANVVQVKRAAVRYDPPSRTLKLEVEVTNTAEKPAVLSQFVTSLLTFRNSDLAPQGEQRFILEPPGPVNPGETKLLRLLMTDQVWEQQRLVDLSQPQLRFGGVLMFESSAGGRRLEREAEEYFWNAIEVARRQQAKSLELRAVMSLARLWQQQRKPEEARHLLVEVYNWFTEGFDTADLQAAKVLLDRYKERP